MTSKKGRPAVKAFPRHLRRAIEPARMGGDSDDDTRAISVHIGNADRGRNLAIVNPAKLGPGVEDLLEKIVRIDSLPIRPEKQTGDSQVPGQRLPEMLPEVVAQKGLVIFLFPLAVCFLPFEPRARFAARFAVGRNDDRRSGVVTSDGGEYGYKFFTVSHSVSVQKQTTTINRRVVMSYQYFMARLSPGHRNRPGSGGRPTGDAPGSSPRRRPGWGARRAGGGRTGPPAGPGRSRPGRGPA